MRFMLYLANAHAAPCALVPHQITGNWHATTLTLLVEHKNQEHRDAHINAGMEAGMQDAMDLLEQVAISLI